AGPQRPRHVLTQVPIKIEAGEGRDGQVLVRHIHRDAGNLLRPLRRFVGGVGLGGGLRHLRRSTLGNVHNLLPRLGCEESLRIMFLPSGGGVESLATPLRADETTRLGFAHFLCLGREGSEGLGAGSSPRPFPTSRPTLTLRNSRRGGEAVFHLLLRLLQESSSPQGSL